MALPPMGKKKRNDGIRDLLVGPGVRGIGALK